MKLSCPACGATGSIEFFLMDASAREAVVAAFNLPPVLSRQVMVYIGLFRPPKRALTWDRVEKLLTELMEPIKAAQVVRNGITYTAPLDYWKDALDQVLTNRSKLTLPLKSHGYLFEIVANMANKAGARAEQKKEQRLRNQGRDRRAGASSVGETLKQTPAGKEAGRKALREAAGLVTGERSDDGTD